MIYCVITAYNRVSKKGKDFGIPVISVGNLLVGGTGKTPVIITLAKSLPYKKAIVLRGYGRKSKGLFVASHEGKILFDLETIGDEAILLAKSLPEVMVIVCENRIQGIEKAKEFGAEVVLLDDGYRHHEIEKFDILLRPSKEPTNIMCLPSGGYRDTKMMYSFANMVLVEGKDFQREVYFTHQEKKIETLPSSLVLLSAISKTDRLLEYLPPNTPSVIFEDHHLFTQDEIDEVLKKYPQSAIVTTRKDFVKLEKFDLDNLYIMELEVQLQTKDLEKIQHYIEHKKDQAQI